MSYSADLTDLLLASALCEEIYRRDTREQSLGQSLTPDYKPDGFQSFVSGVVEAVVVRGGITGLSEDNRYYYYNDATGFVGRVVEANGKIFVVLRGTDLSSEFSDALSAMFADTPAPVNPAGDNTVDNADWYQHYQMGHATLEPSQLDDALKLLDAAKGIADGREIIVTGQSLGGGLAALVTAISSADLSVATEVKGITVAQAPFQDMYEAYRGITDYGDSAFNWDYGDSAFN
jgi:hypothetical protein